MNILIVDDDYSKSSQLSSMFMRDDPDNIVYIFGNLEDALVFINSHSDSIDLILLDWCFPSNSYDRSKYGIGRYVLENLKYHGFNNKVIICSSDVVSIDKDEYPFYLGSIVYCEGLPVIAQVHNLLNNKDNDKDQYVRTLKNKKNNNTGYKRRMSSTPWWLKP